jgi:hypothetical protein
MSGMELDPVIATDRALSKAERDQLFVAEFTGGLIDGRGFIEEQLGRLADHSYACDGFEGRFSAIPEPVARRLGINPDSVLQPGVNVSLAFKTSHDPNRKFSLDFMHLQMVDYGSLFMSYEYPSTIVDPESNHPEYFFGDELLLATLRSFMPNYGEPADDEVLAKAAFAFSPTSTHSMEIRDGNTYLMTTESEDVDQSSYAVDIHTQQPHSSGKIVVMRLGVEEKLSQALDGMPASQSLNLGAGRVVRFDEVLDGRIVTVKKLRKSHALVLQGAVETLLEKSAAGDQGTPWRSGL